MLAIGLGVLAGILFALLTVLVRRGIMRTPDPIAGSVVVVGLAMVIVIVEALANLDRVPDRITFCGFPLNFAGRDGSPVRAVAIIDE